MNKTYKVSKKGSKGLLVLIIAIIAVLFFNSPSPGFIYAAIVIGGIAIIIALRKEYTYCIEIDDKGRTITFITNSRTSTIKDVCSFDELYFTYKKRFDYYSIGFKQMGYPREKRNILQIDCDRKALAFLVPEQDGWTNAVILDIAKTFSAFGIKQIIDKYDDNEIRL